MHVNNFGTNGTSSQIFIQTTCRQPGVITWVQFLGGVPHKIWEGKKPSKIWRDFWQLSTLIANISETDPQIDNRKSSWSTTTPPTFDEKKSHVGLCPAYLVFLFFRHAFSEFPRPIALKLCRMVGIWVYFIMQVQKLGGTPPKKLGGQKHAKFRSILDHFRLWLRISPERLKISKIGRRCKLWQFLLHLTKKVRWTLVH